MSISGEQIRAARERAHLTQEELAQAVGVSLRTVGNWERGESVPRSRMAAIEEVLEMHLQSEVRSKQEIQAVIGELIAAGRTELGLSRPAFAEKVGRSKEAIKNAELGVNWPGEVLQRQLEKALHWRAGVLAELMERGMAGEDLAGVTVEDVTDYWAAAGVEPVTRGADLSTDELLTELTHRVRSMQEKLERGNPDPVKSDPAPPASYGLAAYDLPGEKGRAMRRKP